MVQARLVTLESVRNGRLSLEDFLIYGRWGGRGMKLIQESSMPLTYLAWTIKGCHKRMGFWRWGEFFGGKEEKFRFYLIKFAMSVGHPNGNMELAVAYMSWKESWVERKVKKVILGCFIAWVFTKGVNVQIKGRTKGWVLVPCNIKRSTRREMRE